MQSMVPVQSALSNMQVHETDEFLALGKTQSLTQAEIEEILAQGFDDMIDDDADGVTSWMDTTGEDIDAMAYAYAYDIEHNPIYKIVK